MPGTYDNMKTAADAIGRGKACTVNARFRAMSGHFLFETDFCNPAAGWENGLIEKMVQDSRPRVWREVPSIKYQLKSARFPAYRDLAGFRFEHVAVDVALVKSLQACEFVEQAHNVVLIGNPGPGQTHLATAVGAQVIMHHHLRVRFF